MPRKRCDCLNDCGDDPDIEKGKVKPCQKYVKEKNRIVKTMEFVKLTDRLPVFHEGRRVIIFTEGHDFAGEQYFDVEADSLNECFYPDPYDQPEVCRHASHWAYRPFD